MMILWCSPKSAEMVPKVRPVLQLLKSCCDHSTGALPMESSAASASGGSSNVAALRFSRRCAVEDVPGISRMLGER